MTTECEYTSRNYFVEKKDVTLTLTLECKVEVLDHFTEFISFLANLRRSEL